MNPILPIISVQESCHKRFSSDNAKANAIHVASWRIVGLTMTTNESMMIVLMKTLKANLFHDLYCFIKLDGEKLGDAVAAHCDAVEDIGTTHSLAVVSNDDKLGLF